MTSLWGFVHGSWYTLWPQFWYVPELCNSGTYQNWLSHVAIHAWWYTLWPQFWYVPELCNSGTYQNWLSHVAILERTRIVQFRYVPELSDYTILVHVFFQNCYYNLWIIFLWLAVNYFSMAFWMTPQVKLHYALRKFGYVAKYNMTKSRPEGDNPLEGKLFPVETPQGCHICIINIKWVSIYGRMGHSRAGQRSEW